MKKQIIFMSILTLILASSLAYAGDYCLYSMSDGESTTDNVYTCTHTRCITCVDSNKNYASWNKCTGVQACTFAQPDVPLSLSAGWPFTNGGVFTKTSLFFDIATSKIATIYLVDNIAGTQKTLCPNCKSYRRSVTFKPGWNDLTIRAVKGLEIQEESISFFIDNKKPIISKTLPASNKYAASIFSVMYSESNVQEIKLKYGNNLGGMRETIFTDCASGVKQTCSRDIDLRDYDGSQIIYWFEIKDIANNLAVGRQTKIYVDETAPEITAFSHELIKKYMYFNITVEDANFKKIEYMDNNDKKPRWKTLCSSLKNGNCFKKLSFKNGEHDLIVRVSDKAGNIAEAGFGFTAG